jgi:hypothetical protein
MDLKMIMNNIKLILIRDNKDIKKLQKLFYQKKYLKDYEYLEEFLNSQQSSKLKQYGILTVDEELFENLLAIRPLFYNMKNSKAIDKRVKYFKEITDLLSNINKFEVFEKGTEPCLEFFQEIYMHNKNLINLGHKQVDAIAKDLNDLSLKHV